MKTQKEKLFITAICLNVILILSLVVVYRTDNLLLITILDILTFINAVYIVSEVFKMKKEKSNEQMK